MQTETEAEVGGNGKKKAKKRLTAKDFVELSLYSVFIVQQRGQLTIPELQDVFRDEVGAIVHEGTLHKTLEALRARNFVTANLAGGEWRWSIGKVKFTSSATENAHLSSILPTLYADPAGMAIKAEIEAGVSDKTGAKDQKYPRDYCDFTAIYRLDDYMLGAQILDGNPSLAEEIKRSPYNSTLDFAKDPKETIRVFERGPKGELRIHRDCVRGAFEKHLPMIRDGKGLHIRYFFFEPVLLAPKKEQFGFRRVPVLGRDNTGRTVGVGITFHEACFGPLDVAVRFSAPTTNFITPEAMKAWCGRWFRRYARSISPARGGQCGGGELIDFSFEKVEFDLSSLADDEEGGSLDE